MNKPVTYRPKGNIVWGSVALLLVGLDLTQAIFYATKDQNVWVDVLVAIAVALAAFAIWLRPKLVLHAEHMVVVNPIRTKTIAYRDIRELDTKWTLQVHHVGGSTRVWVAPANGKFRWIAESNQGRLSKKLPIIETNLVDVTSMSASHKSDSGVAAALIRERIEASH